MSKLRNGLVGAVIGVGCLGLAGAAVAGEVTNANDDLRTGWYPDEGSITPQLVTGGTFGQLWSASVDGQVYAQPLLSPSGTLIVATENDMLYGLDPSTGNQQWAQNLAPNGPWNPADLGCSDLEPWVGTTATPVIDTSTNTVYLTYKTYDDNHDAVWYMDARNVSTGQEQPGWPVQLSGNADNEPSVPFDATDQQQRPGLLLMNGVVYAAFGSHCDTTPFEGWVFGVATAGHITAKWVDNTDGTGGGIWQSGVGLTSDGSGTILLATGNGGSPTTPTPGNSPPASCGECVMRLDVQPDGTLKPVDFFAPFDADQLDQYDADFGSGGVVALPDQYFGTSSVPHLAVAVGKEGDVYLLNRDDLGGYDQGPGGADDVVQTIGPNGSVYGRAGVWPGDGGYLYMPTSSGQSDGGYLDVYKYGVDGSGDPSLSLAGTSSDVFGWGSGSPVITSDDTTTGSALVWIIWSADRQGDGGQLRAYNPVPDASGTLDMVWSGSIGSATNYSTPGVGAGRLYVGTRDGHVLGFGSPVTQPLSGSALSFPRTTIGSSSAPETMTLTANSTLTITGLSSSSSQFSLGTSSPSLPVTLQAHQTISVPVTFSPTQTGLVAGQLTADTDAGNEAFQLQGTGQTAPGQLSGNPAVLSLGGTSVGGHLSGAVTFSNVGGQALTVQSVGSPSAPFSISGAPAAGDTLAPGQSVTVDVSFDPTSTGKFNDAVTLNTTDGESQPIGLSASAATPGQLEISSEAIDFGTVPVGGTATRTFMLTNAGGTGVEITKSKPPFGGAFTASTALPEGTTISPGQTLTESVTFNPTSPGSATGIWQINGNDPSGLQIVQFTGDGGAATVAATSGATPAASSAAAPTGAAATSPPVIPAAPKFAAAVTSTAKLAGTYITYTAPVAGVSRFALEQATTGRRGAHGCVAITARNRSRPACTLYVVVATFTHHDHVGANKLRLGAYVAVRKLLPGRYQLRSTLLDSDGARHSFNTSFRVLTPARRHATVVDTTTVGSLVRGLLLRLSLLF